MKRLKIYCLMLFFTLTSIFVFAQNHGFYWNDLDESSNRLQGKLAGETYFITSIANSNFFLQKKMVNANITLVDGDVFEGVKVRYLAYSDELIAYNSKIRTLYTLDKSIIKEFIVNDEDYPNRRFFKLPFESLGKTERFFEELYEGTRSLLAYHKVDAIKVSPFTDKAGIMRDTEYRLNVIYYMYSEETGPQKIRIKKRSFYKILPEHKKQIRKIFRQNKTFLSDENSMIQAFTLLDKAGIFN